MSEEDEGAAAEGWQRVDGGLGKDTHLYAQQARESHTAPPPGSSHKACTTIDLEGDWATIVCVLSGLAGDFGSGTIFRIGLSGEFSAQTGARSGVKGGESPQACRLFIAVPLASGVGAPTQVVGPPPVWSGEVTSSTSTESVFPAEE